MIGLGNSPEYISKVRPDLRMIAQQLLFPQWPQNDYPLAIWISRLPGNHRT